jgi:hypothetical protein
MFNLRKKLDAHIAFSPGYQLWIGRFFILSFYLLHIKGSRRSLTIWKGTADMDENKKARRQLLIGLWLNKTLTYFL